jgi:Raf kinase inhibitor-like YbhB/YbcL family protein
MANRSAADTLTALSLTSPAFKDGAAIPAQFTCDGGNRSPALSWSGAPDRTASYALLVEDPDAPGGTFVHWVIYDIPANVHSLPEGIAKGATVASLGAAKQGQTGFKGTPGYGGPCPPKGPAHHYHFRLFALDKSLGLESGASRDDVVKAMRGHELARGELVGTYARQR